MKKLLLVTSTLLSLAMSENVLMENHSRSKRAWNSEDKLKKEKQMPQDDSPFDVEELVNYARRISDTRFISEPMKFSSLAFIRQLDADKPKLNKQPIVLISIGVQEATKTSGNSRLQENCSTRKNYRKYNQDWQLQQPFYVEEPKWIEIDSNIDGSSGRRVDDNDPYILSRGKRIFRIKDPMQTNKIAQDYNEFPDYPSKGRLRLSTKSRVRRSIEVTKHQDGPDEKAHQDEERLDHNEIQVALGTNKRLAISKDVKFAEAAGERKTYQVDLLDASPGKKIKNNETTNIFERIESKSAHIIDKLGNLDTYEDIRSRSKLSENETRISNKDPIEKKPWEHDEEDKFDETDEFDDDAETMDSQSASLIGESEALATKDHPNREKRNACKNAACVSPQLDEWLRNIERYDSSLKRRDKHHDILESLRLNEPYVISRGKKASNTEDPLSALRLRSASPVTPSAAKNLLRTLLLSMTRSKCSSNNCDLNAFELTPDRQEFEPRDRRGTLDEILAGYDPFYVVRGKRADMENAVKVVSRF